MTAKHRIRAACLHAVSLLLMLVLLLPAVCAEAEEPSAMSWEEFDAAPGNAPCVIETYIQSFRISFEKRLMFFARSPDGGYAIHTLLSPETGADLMVPGLPVRITGKKIKTRGEAFYFERPEIEVLDREPWVADPVDITGLLGTEEMARYKYMFVSMKGLTVVPSRGMFDKEDRIFRYGENGGTYHADQGQLEDLWFCAELDGLPFHFAVPAKLTGYDTELCRAVMNLKAGDVLDLEGYYYWDTSPVLYLTNLTPGTPGEPSPERRAKAEAAEPEPEKTPDPRAEMAGIWTGTSKGVNNYEKADMTLRLDEDGTGSMWFSSNGQTLVYPCLLSSSGKTLEVGIPSNYIGLSGIKVSFSVKDGRMKMDLTFTYTRGGNRTYTADLEKQ